MSRYFGTHALEGEWHALLPRYLLLGDRVRGSRVLDIGCGTGIGSSLLLELGAESVSGVDHRPEVLELARMKHDKQGLDFHVMFWEELEFPDDSFDVVVCLDPASPITDPNLLMEVRRVLGDGGEYICALDRTTVSGLESLLPRYGYASSMDEVSIGKGAERVPQVGELTTYFETIVSVVQRPRLSFTFEREPSAAGEDADGSQMRRVPDSDGGLWSASEASSDPSSGGGKWISVDRHLSDDDDDLAAVEIFFCGDAHLPPPPLREIRLPYYNIVERLEQLIGDLQMRQGPGGEPSSFDEVLDEPTGSVIDESDADSSAEREWDETPTQVLDRADTALRDQQRSNRSIELDSQLAHLRDLYRQVRRDFDQLLHQTEAALSERDDYIDHLVGTVHQWQDRFGGIDAGDPDVSETATTSVFKIDDLREQAKSRPVIDELAELDDSTQPDEIEAQIASLQEEQERIRDLLSQREARLAELAAELERDDDSSAADSDSEPGDSQADDSEADDSQADAPSDGSEDSGADAAEAADGDPEEASEPEEAAEEKSPEK
jgi:hypothetical protein